MDRRNFCRSTLAGAGALAFAPWQGYAEEDVLPAEIPAIAGSGDAIAIERAAVDELRTSLRGRLLLPETAGYEDARRLRNRMIDKRPALIAQCTGASDVREAINFARHYGLLTAIKCGGHNIAGKGSCNGGIMIDLSPMQGVRVDPIARTATVAGGSLLNALDEETQAFGLATTSGTVSHTGVGGLSLGGGFGRLARRFGLAVDNIEAVDIINADGQFRRACAEENADLYWGVRGGGGNFGVVTSFDFKLHPMAHQIIGGRISFPYSNAKDLLKFYADYSQSVPDDMYVDIVIFAPPMGYGKTCYFEVCYSGPHNKADAVLAPLRRAAKPVKDDIRAMDYVALQSSSDDTDPRGTGQYLKSGFTTEINDDLVDALVDNLEPHPDRGGMAFFQHSGGEVGRIATDATAFSHRYANHNMTIGAVWRHGTETDSHVAWARQYWQQVEGHTHGFYTNDAYAESQSKGQANYQGNYDRLVDIKNKYDPTNLFRLNTNIRPTV
jgi:FAD/FMN-containing dehydrogenase